MHAVHLFWWHQFLINVFFSAHQLHHDKGAKALQPHRRSPLLRIRQEENHRVCEEIHAEVRRKLQEVSAVMKLVLNWAWRNEREELFMQTYVLEKEQGTFFSESNSLARYVLLWKDISWDFAVFEYSWFLRRKSIAAYFYWERSKAPEVNVEDKFEEVLHDIGMPKRSLSFSW